MRNWNMDMYVQDFGDELFTSYLWGIETEVGEDNYYVDKDNSHPTYEELKQGVRNSGRGTGHHSHPTYEELKQEGSAIPCYIRFWIHILPMRNWNYPICIQ